MIGESFNEALLLAAVAAVSSLAAHAEKVSSRERMLDVQTGRYEIIGDFIAMMADHRGQRCAHGARGRGVKHIDLAGRTLLHG